MLCGEMQSVKILESEMILVAHILNGIVLI